MKPHIESANYKHNGGKSCFRKFPSHSVAHPAAGSFPNPRSFGKKRGRKKKVNDPNYPQS